MKPWEEAWFVHEDTAGEPDVYRSPDPDTLARVLASDGTEPEDFARARLAAAAPEMARLLLSRYEKHAENDAGNDSTDWYCLACGRGGLPHAPDCRLVAVLRKAGVIG